MQNKTEKTGREPEDRFKARDKDVIELSVRGLKRLFKKAAGRKYTLSDFSEIRTSTMTEYRNGDERFKADFCYKAKRRINGSWRVDMYEISYSSTGVTESLLRTYGTERNARDAILKLKALEDAYPHKSDFGKKASGYYRNVAECIDGFDIDSPTPQTGPAKKHRAKLVR